MFAASGAVMLAGYTLLSSRALDPLPAARSKLAAGSHERPAPVKPRPQTMAAATAPPLAPSPTLAPSLRGTVIDGALVVDADGRFVPTTDALDLFDYFFSALGEQSHEEIVARIELEIRARLDPPDDALELFEHYLAYRDAVRALAETYGIETLPLEQRLQRLREIRRDEFGAEIASQLFEEDEARAREAIAWREVALDPDATPEERAAHLEALEAQLPETELQRRKRATVAHRLIEEEAELRAEGASAAEIDTRRQEAFGDEAAARLAALDQARAEWNGRVADYRAERQELDATAFTDDAEAAAALEALRSSHFDGPELLRIRALDDAEARTDQ